jgi:hypothetical protein
VRELDVQLDKVISTGVDDTFARDEALDPKVFCETAVPELGRLEGSFRFTDFYERMMAL